MRVKFSLLISGATAVVLLCGGSACTSTVASQGQYITVSERDHSHRSVFSNSTEAEMLRRAYGILAVGNHDYEGHRAKAMQSIDAAANLLGMDLVGDGYGGRPQPLSDERLREARGLLERVLRSAAIKDQARVAKRLKEAIDEISIALQIR
jgi:hypothetical protein